jgi:hypothetical protein
VDRTSAALIVLGVLLALLALMAVGWWWQKKRQSSLPAAESPPAKLGSVLGSFSGMYVATTKAGDPLNRIAVRGLGYRARTTITVTEAGIVLPIKGQPEIWIPSRSIREIGRASWVIDKAVEPGGLTVVGWFLGETELDSYFRLENPEGFALAARPSVNRKEMLP